jgi:hypothetical protein
MQKKTAHCTRCNNKCILMHRFNTPWPREMKAHSMQNAFCTLDANPSVTNAFFDASIMNAHWCKYSEAILASVASVVNCAARWQTQCKRA